MLHLFACRWRCTELDRAWSFRYSLGFRRRWELDLGYHCVFGIPSFKQAVASDASCMLVGNRADGSWVGRVAVHGSVGDFLLGPDSVVLMVNAS